MRFEAKKKALAAATKIVRSMTDALSASGTTAGALHLIAEGKTVKLRTVSGAQIVESVLGDDVVVHEAGSAPVDAAALTNALSVGGETFKVNKDGQYLDFACGRSKGRLEVKASSEDTQDSTVADAPKPTIQIPGFKALLKAITLKGTAKSERVFHFDDQKQAVRGEATDSFRGISVVAPLGKGNVAESVSISLPAKAMDSLAFLIDDCLVGFDERFFSIKSPGLFVSMPQSTTPAVDIAGQLSDWLGSQTKKAEFEVSIKEIKEAIADAIAISTDKSGSRLTVSLGPNGGRMLGEGDSGKVETDFSVAQTDADAVFSAQIVPSFLRECLDFYAHFDTVKISIYNQALVLGLVDSTDLLSSQTTAIPLLAEVTEEAAPKKKAAPKPEPAKPAAKKKGVPDDEDEAPPTKAKKPPVADDDEEEPVAKPAPKKKPPVEDDDDAPAPVAKKPAKVVDEDDEEEDEEDFDDEE